jgi:glycerol uptake facilitator-like aquaporin
MTEADVRTLKLYVYALGGIPLGLYLLARGEFLGALVFLGIGAGCLLFVLDDHLPGRMPRWMLSAALWCLGVGMVALVALAVRASM